MYGNKLRTVRYTNPINIGLFAGTNSKNVDSAMILAQKLIQSVKELPKQATTETLKQEPKRNEILEALRERMKELFQKEFKPKEAEKKKEFSVLEGLKEKIDNLENLLSKPGITQEELTEIYKELDETRAVYAVEQLNLQMQEQKEIPEEPKP